MKPSSKVVFLFDVDNTLLDNDRIESDLRSHLESEFGAESRDRYFAVVHHYPFRHYVVVDDKLRILSAIKRAWGGRVTTVWRCQGRYAFDSKAVAMYPSADLAIGHIGDLINYDLPGLMSPPKP